MRTLLLLLFLSLCQPGWAEKKVYLTSLEWPPYAGKNLPQQGASVAVASAAFKAMGYTLVVDFFPWSRAVNQAQITGSKYAGYFPEYYSDAVAKNFIYSKSMGSGPLGFAEQTKKPVSWDQLSELKNKRIGTVQDYVNTAEFDSMVAKGELNASTVISDVSNLKKLISDRLDLVVIDKNVMAYLLKTDRLLKDKVSQATFQKRLLEEKHLFICFKNDKLGEQLANIYNQGLGKIDIQSIMSKYLNNI